MKNNYQPFGWLLLLLLISVGCKLPTTALTYSTTNKYNTCGGAEDIVIDTVSNITQPRLIASCADYAHKRTTNCLQAIELTSRRVHTLLRTNEPSNMPFVPHGIDLARFNDSLFLYVINHESKNITSILTYYVKDTTLKLTKRFTSKLLTSPNDISVNSKREIYITNDHHKSGNETEIILNQKKGTVVQISNDVCTVFSKGYCYANGILANDSGVYVSTVRQNKLFFVPYNLPLHKRVVARFKGQDNITYTANKLYVTSHPKQLRFVRHAKNQEVKSPTVVYEVNLITGHKRVVYSNNGTQINAATTALRFGNKLYLSQLFVPFVLELQQ